jgi:pimeloyl-ACP methyl ester carboxylesterase
VIETGGASKLTVRLYGESGPAVLLLHGGPGAAGYMAPIARELSDSFRVIEPFQRRRENEPLTVRRHTDDLNDVITQYCTDEQPAIVGHSWGAMLALAYAAEHPTVARCLVLIGCGTFDKKARNRLQSTLVARTTAQVSSRLRRLSREICDPDVRLCVYGRLLEPLYIYDALPNDKDETEEYDRKGHDESWRDMLRLQGNRTYPQAFRAIETPTLMIHGDWDPHPGRMTLDTLGQHMPAIEYVELINCGHYPWRERKAAEVFFDQLRQWLCMYMT